MQISSFQLDPVQSFVVGIVGLGVILVLNKQADQI